MVRMSAAATAASHLGVADPPAGTGAYAAPCCLGGAVGPPGEGEQRVRQFAGAVHAVLDLVQPSLSGGGDAARVKRLIEQHEPWARVVHWFLADLCPQELAAQCGHDVRGCPFQQLRLSRCEVRLACATKCDERPPQSAAR
jgi:hypothetical protein